MSSQLSTQDLIDWYQDPVKLQWMGGKTPCDQQVYISSNALSQLCGCLNPIRWHALQFIDEQAHRYLQSLSEEKIARLSNELKPMTGLGIINLTQQICPSAFIKQKSFSVFSMESPKPIELDTFQNSLIELSSSKLSVHGNVVEILGRGVLILGEPGMGKSAITLQLLKRGHCLVADDIVDIFAGSSGKIFAQCPSNSVGIMHVRGLGFFDAARIYGANKIRKKTEISLVISLKRPAQRANDWEVLITSKKSSQRYFNVRIPEWELHSGVPGLAEKIEAISESLLSPKLPMNGFKSMSAENQGILNINHPNKVNL